MMNLSTKEYHKVYITLTKGSGKLRMYDDMPIGAYLPAVVDIHTAIMPSCSSIEKAIPLPITTA